MRRSAATTASPISPIRSRSPASSPATGWTSRSIATGAAARRRSRIPPVKLPEIERRFGREIAGLVDGVTKLTRLELQSDRTKQAENFRKLVLAMSRDIRVLLVKLADRLHNMRTLHFVPETGAARSASRARRWRSTRRSPSASAWTPSRPSCRRLAFAQLEPEAYATIQARLNFLRGQGADVIEEVRQRADPGLPRGRASAASR